MLRFVSPSHGGNTFKMRLLIKKPGKNNYEWVQNVESVIVFDDVKARIEVCADCCVKVPVIKNGDVLPAEDIKS